jgi:trk system potassium uptake protein TrkA
MSSGDGELYVVVVGCGRLGAFLANRLSADGHSVVVIDVRAAALEALSEEFSGFHVEGDATEFGVLEQAKPRQADLVIATTRHDNVNLMVAQVARKLFEVPRVVARVFDPERVELYRFLGVEPLCPTSLAGQVVLDSLTDEADDGQGGSA